MKANFKDLKSVYLFVLFSLILSQKASAYCYNLAKMWEVQCQPVASVEDSVNLSNTVSFSGYNEIRKFKPECMGKPAIANGYRSDVAFNNFNLDTNQFFAKILNEPLSFERNTEGTTPSGSFALYVSNVNEFSENRLNITTTNPEGTAFAQAILPISHGMPLGTARFIINFKSGGSAEQIFTGCRLVEGEKVEIF